MNETQISKVLKITWHKQFDRMLTSSKKNHSQPNKLFLLCPLSLFDGRRHEQAPMHKKVVWTKKVVGTSVHKGQQHLRWKFLLQVISLSEAWLFWYLFQVRQCLDEAPNRTRFKNVVVREGSQQNAVSKFSISYTWWHSACTTKWLLTG
jgi:hypothetical protein